jgi:sugar phosphate isomerase/epimerase
LKQTREKKGWTDDELRRLVKLTDSCSDIANAKKIQIVFENLNEPFFGVDSMYRGLDNYFSATAGTGLQFDIGNAFRNSSG